MKTIFYFINEQAPVTKIKQYFCIMGIYENLTSSISIHLNYMWQHAYKPALR